MLWFFPESCFEALRMRNLLTGSLEHVKNSFGNFPLTEGIYINFQFRHGPKLSIGFHTSHATCDIVKFSENHCVYQFRMVIP